MLSGEDSTRISSQYHQVKAGGDLAALTGICKAVVELERDASGGQVLDHDVHLGEHTHGFDSFVRLAASAQDWAESGTAFRDLQRSAIADDGGIPYAQANAAIGIYGMGLTQHRAGVETVQMLVNLLLLARQYRPPGRGHLPRPRPFQRAGPAHRRHHREAQAWSRWTILATQYGFEPPPTEPGLNTVEACEAILAGQDPGLHHAGGQFRPRHSRIATGWKPAWRRMRLTVNVATKLNRSHLVHGQISYILPVKGRIEVDHQATGPQATSMEDSTSCIHGSLGVRAPAGKHLISEIDFIARLAEVALEPNPNVPWKAWNDDYSLIRAAIGHTYPENFYDYERRMWEPGGFHRKLPARHRIWKTKTGRANFITPTALAEDADMPEFGRDVLRLITLRSNDQFNTTVYGYSDRFRGIEGTRMVVLMNADDIARLDLTEGETVAMETVSTDGHLRRMGGFRVTTYNIPAGCAGAYYPEANALLPLGHYAKGSKTPAAKSIPIRILRAEETASLVAAE